VPGGVLGSCEPIRGFDTLPQALVSCRDHRGVTRMDYRRVARKSEHQYNREYSAGYRQCDETVISEPEHAVYNDRLKSLCRSGD